MQSMQRPGMGESEVVACLPLELLHGTFWRYNHTELRPPLASRREEFAAAR